MPTSAASRPAGPLWVTEMNVPLPWPGLKRFREPSRAYMAAQAERVAKLYAVSIHEGAAATFYFLLHPLHRPATSTWDCCGRISLRGRPTWRLAAVGRLLADARPLGKLNINNPRLYAYIFRAKPDGKDHVVLVAWATDPCRDAGISRRRRWRLYDVLGPSAAGSRRHRIIDCPGDRRVGGRDGGKAPNSSRRPRRPAWLEGKPSPVVLQARLCRSSGFRMAAVGLYRRRKVEFDRIPIYVYNFGPEKVEGRLALKGPEGLAHLNLPRIRPSGAGRAGGIGADLRRAESGRRGADRGH